MRVLSLLTVFLLVACSRDPGHVTAPTVHTAPVTPPRPTYITARLIDRTTVEITATAATRPLYLQNCNGLPYVRLFTRDFRLLTDPSPAYPACASEDLRIDPRTSRTFQHNVGPLSALPQGRYRVSLGNLYYSPSPGRERPHDEHLTSEPILVVP